MLTLFLFFGVLAAEPKVFLAAIEAAVKKVIAAESDITRFDTIAGDGDAGAFELLPQGSNGSTLMRITYMLQV